MEYNLYCDESCHLENDGYKAMVLGTIYCPKNKKNNIFDNIKHIKNKHGFSSNFEIKWNKTNNIKTY